MVTKDKVTIKIPRALYERIKVLIANSGFDSATDFIVYVLRDLVGTSLSQGAGEELTQEEIKAIRARLKGLGYLD